MRAYTSSESTHAGVSAISAAAAARSAAGDSPPVGLCGELRMTRRVRSLRRGPSSSVAKLNPSSSRSGSGTGVAPAQRIADS
jgi:hypothetical protein